MTKKQQAREELFRFASSISPWSQKSEDTAGGGINLVLQRVSKVDALVLAAKQLRRVYERQCNGYQTWDFKPDEKAELRDERKETRLMETIKNLVSDLSGGSLVPVFQSDPRGASVILVKPGTEATYLMNGSGEILTVPDWL